MLVCSFLMSIMLFSVINCATSPCGPVICGPGTTCQLVQSPNLYGCKADSVTVKACGTNPACLNGFEKFS